MDLRIIASLAGAVLALVAGVTLGGALRPDLFELVGGPRTLAGWAGMRAAPTPGDIDLYANYRDKLPDYVLGTDATQPPPAETAPEPEPLPAADAPTPRSAVLDPKVAPAPPPSAYPSMAGGASLEQDIPPPPPPPDDADR